jgi:hypothetical protein
MRQKENRLISEIMLVLSGHGIINILSDENPSA